MIALRSVEAKEPFLQYWIVAIPKSEAETDRLPAIADAGEAVLIPPVRTRTSVVMRKIIPRTAIRRVIFSNGAPRTFREIRSPTFPVPGPGVRLSKALLFCVHKLIEVNGIIAEFDERSLAVA
jgi:hypothetical protein